MQAGWERGQASDNSGSGKGEEMVGAAAATLGSQMPSPVAAPGPGGGAQVCGAESARVVRA